MQRFLDDPAFLSDVARFDLPLLGDVAGLRGVHLQCHIGTDTVSLARLGASMTGLDFSGAAVAEAGGLPRPSAPTPGSSKLTSTTPSAHSSPARLTSSTPGSGR